MTTLQISLLGRFRAISSINQHLDALCTGKAGELFCFLLLQREHSYPREYLAELLWPDCSNAHSRKYLRQALWQLQSNLNSQLKGTINAPVLVVEHSFVSINTDAAIWLDIDIFEQAFVAVQDIRGYELDTDNASRLKDAVQLYVNDLLYGWYHEWCLYERERLRSIYLIMLDKLMSYCQEHKEYEAGITYGHRILSYEQAHERTHRKLMRLYYLSGDRTGALRQFQSCVAILERELGVSPTQDTVALYEQIKCDKLEAVYDSGAPSDTPSGQKPLASIHATSFVSARA